MYGTWFKANMVVLFGERIHFWKKHRKLLTLLMVSDLISLHWHKAYSNGYRFSESRQATSTNLYLFLLQKSHCLKLSSGFLKIFALLDVIGLDLALMWKPFVLI